MEAIGHGWRLGKSLRPLFGADWVTMLEWPLTRVREHFGMKPGDVFVRVPVVVSAMAARWSEGPARGNKRGWRRAVAMRW